MHQTLTQTVKDEYFIRNWYSLAAMIASQRRPENLGALRPTDRDNGFIQRQKLIP